MGRISNGKRIGGTPSKDAQKIAGVFLLKIATLRQTYSEITLLNNHVYVPSFATTPTPRVPRLQCNNEDS